MVKRKVQSREDDLRVDRSKKKMKVESSRVGTSDEPLQEEDNKGKGLWIGKKLKGESSRVGTSNESLPEEDNKGKGLQIGKKLKVESNRVGTSDESSQEEDSKGKRLQIEKKKDNAKRQKRKLKGVVIREKKKLEKVKLVKERVEIKDCLSELPDHIIHHILGFLQNPKDAARTSILSKKWKSIWGSFPIFDFDQRCFRPRDAGYKSRKLRAKGMDLENFKEVVNKSLSTRLAAMTSIEKFKLYVFVNRNPFTPLHHWILAAMTKNVKDLEIHVHRRGISHSFPQAALSSKTLTSLKLFGLKVGHAPNVKLDNLRVLSIKNAPVNAGVIGKFISNCLLMEDFRLVNCTGISKLNISGVPKLRRVELHKCAALTDVEIDAPNLVTFWFHESLLESKIRLVSCTNLKSFTLNHSFISDEEFQKQLSMYPNLEKLELVECTKLERVTILSDKIKRLSLLRCFKLEEINIDAPYLTSLEYTGDKVPFSSMNISSLHGVKLYFLSLKKKRSYRCRLESFLGQFNQYNGFKLLVCSFETLTIYEEFRGNMPLPSRTFKLEFTKSSRKLRDMFVSWFAKTSPSTLTVLSSSSSEFLQFVQEMILSKEKNPDCCKLYSNKCWRHYLQDAKLSHDTPDQKTYKLKWKPKTLRKSSDACEVQTEV